MQSWRLTEQVLIPELTSQEALAKLIDIYDNSINNPTLKKLESRTDRLGGSYRAVLNEWNSDMKPMLANPEKYPLFISLVPDYVDRIDSMVYALQHNTEQKLTYLFIAALILFMGILAIGFIAIQFIQHNLLEPIRDLSMAARKVRSGEFKNLSLSYNAENETGRLTQTFKLMANDLADLYGHLEDKVEEKTLALEQSNTALQLLYDASRTLGFNPYDSPEVAHLVEGWKQLLKLDSCYICLSDTADSIRLKRIAAMDELPTKECGKADCLGCVNHGNHRKLHRSQQQWQFDISLKGRCFGFLSVTTRLDKELTDESQQWLQTFSDIVATSLYQGDSRTQERRILLMEERAVIARELHDSLAQALSYQKIQVVRLKRQLSRHDEIPAVSNVMNELQDGLNNAYRQLRELLNTFRLTVSDNDLEAALENTLAEYRNRAPKLEYSLDYQLRYCPLDAHYQIHLLQIIREALANVVQHADAEKVIILCRQNEDNQVVVTIDDDGRGISISPEVSGHYGTTIMKERASTMGGVLSFDRAPIGGARIALEFCPTA